MSHTRTERRGRNKEERKRIKKRGAIIVGGRKERFACFCSKSAIQ